MTILVQPDPPHEGQSVTVTVTGRGPYFYRVGEADWQPLPVDEETGTATLVLPPGSGGEIFDVSDRNLPDSEDYGGVISSTR